MAYNSLEDRSPAIGQRPERPVTYRLLGRTEQHTYRWSGKEDQSCWDMLVYAGSDGSILAYQPIPPRGGNRANRQNSMQWIQLKQARTKDHGYWKVSISQSGKKVAQPHVHRLVKTAHSHRESGKTVVEHKNGRPFDNTLGNLDWGDSNTNQQAKHRYAKVRKREAAQVARASVTIQLIACEDGWRGKLLLKDGALFELPTFGVLTRPKLQQLHGKNPSHLVSDLMFRFLRKMESATFPEKQERFFRGQTDEYSRVNYPLGFYVPLESGLLAWQKYIERDYPEQNLVFSEVLQCEAQVNSVPKPMAKAAV